MQFLKNIGSIFHRLVLCALLSAIFWGWVFSLAMDVKPEKKVTLYADCPAIDDIALAEKLEEDLPEGIKAMEVHSFDYAMFSQDIVSSDLYILPASKLGDYPDAFTGSEMRLGAEALTLEDGAVVYKIYDGQTRSGILTDYITYWNDDTPPEDYYLAYGLNSVHLADGAAQFIAEQLLQLP